jgi:hypothetical protein
MIFSDSVRRSGSDGNLHRDSRCRDPDGSLSELSRALDDSGLTGGRAFRKICLNGVSIGAKIMEVNMSIA